MKNCLNAFVLAVLLMNLPALSYAADPAKGQELSRQCSVCHGKLGLAKDPEVPNLAGQSAFYVEKSLRDYQSGAREDRRMTLMVQNLSVQDIKDIAAWYESIIVTAEAPEKPADD